MKGVQSTLKFTCRFPNQTSRKNPLWHFLSLSILIVRFLNNNNNNNNSKIVLKLQYMSGAVMLVYI